MKSILLISAMTLGGVGLVLTAAPSTPAPVPQAVPAPPPQAAGAITSFSIVQVTRPDGVVMYRVFGTVNTASPEYAGVGIYNASGRMFAGLGLCTPSGEFSGLVYLRYGIDRDFGPGDTVAATLVDAKGNVLGTRTALVP